MDEIEHVTSLDFTLTYTVEDDGVHLICPICHERTNRNDGDITLGDALLKASEHMSERHDGR